MSDNKEWEFYGGFDTLAFGKNSGGAFWTISKDDTGRFIVEGYRSEIAAHELDPKQQIDSDCIKTIPFLLMYCNENKLPHPTEKQLEDLEIYR